MTAKITTKMTRIDYGEELYKIVRSVDPPAVDLVEGRRFIARSAGRLLEETVELVLACGLPVHEVLAHVVDALHSEALKMKVYPSEVGMERYSEENIRGELVDTRLLHDYLQFLTEVEISEQDKMRKTTRLATLAREGKMKIVEGLMYRKESGR